MQTCKICGSATQLLFTQKVLSKYDVGYHQCSNCMFIQTDEPYWLDEAYTSAINTSDTGILIRNERFRSIVSVLLSRFWGNQKKYLDYAGGYGIFTRMMRDVGFDFFWVDPYAKNLLAIGFEHQNNTKYEAITAFEVFEHLPNPISEIEKMLSYSSTIIFSTQLTPDNHPDLNWWYYGFNHGQHVALYHKKSLVYLAKKFNLNLYTDGAELHILTSKKLNKLSVKLAFKLAKWGGFYLVKLTSSSKTISDHYQLLKQK